MFSKALFKQSCKANGIMWSIITFAVCFMLACVMLISGGGNLAEVKNGIQDTIIQGEIESKTKEASIHYYDAGADGLFRFNEYFKEEFQNSDFTVPEVTGNIANAEAIGKQFEEELAEKINAAANAAGLKAGDRMMEYAKTQSADAKEVEQLQMIYGFLLNPEKNGSTEREADFVYKETGETEMIDNGENYYHVMNVHVTGEILGKKIDTITPNEDCGMTLNVHLTAKVQTLINLHITGTYEFAKDNQDYLLYHCRNTLGIVVAYGVTNEKAVTELVESLEEYGMTREKYDSYGYTYPVVRTIADRARESYISQLKVCIAQLPVADQTNPIKIAEVKKKVAGDVFHGFLEALPDEVAEALRETGSMDLYNLVVGSIYFKMAGLLLPIIYVIMCANSLIAGQVDSGSMAYILSTSTKRKQVTFTQAIYLVLSIFLMTLCTTIVSMVCLSIVKTEDISMSYGQLLLLNLGSFVTLFAISGLCFMTSCIFNRSKRAMAIGGGLSMFFLVSTMLGLFGSPVLPSLIRLDALNNFNYVSLITLFDVVSISEGTFDYIWKFIILVIIGVACYIIGDMRFKKKDLPL